MDKDLGSCGRIGYAGPLVKSGDVYRESIGSLTSPRSSNPIALIR